MRVIDLQNGQWASWGEFAAGHARGSLFHDPRWSLVLQNAFPHIKAHYLAAIEPDTNAILAGLPLFEVRSPIFGDRLVGVPYSTWCDPLISHPEQLPPLLKAARDLAETLRSRRIEVRCRAPGPLVDMAGWSLTKSWKLHVTPLRHEESELWGNLSRTAVRQMVRRAEKRGVIVTVDNGRPALREFHETFVDMRRRLNLPVIPFRYFSALHDHLSGGAINLLVARCGDRTVGAVLALGSHGTFHLEFSADTESASELGAMQLLYWRAMQMARAEGFREFSFGRTALDHDGLLAYKRHWHTLEEDLTSLVWNRKETRRPSARSPASRMILRYACKLMPRSLYKGLGSLIYSHWG